jgi:hypothetical protein
VVRPEGFGPVVSVHATSGFGATLGWSLALVLGGLGLLAAGVGLSMSPEQQNVPLLLAVSGGLALLLIGCAVWYGFLPLFDVWGLRVQIHPEGLVLVQAGTHRAVRWEDVVSVESRTSSPGYARSGLEAAGQQAMIAGSRLRYTLVLRDGSSVRLNSFVEGLPELGRRIEDEVARSKASPRREGPAGGLPKFRGD